MKLQGTKLIQSGSGSFANAVASGTHLRLLQCTFLLIFSSSLSFSQTVNLKSYSGVAKTLSQLTTDPIVLLQPGKFLDPLYDHSNLDQGYASASEFNRMLRPTLIYSGTSKDLSAVYTDILTQEQWALSPLLPAQVAEMNRLRNLLYKNNQSPTAAYDRYLKKKKAFEDLREIYEKTPEDQRTPELEASYREAEDELMLAGRATYEPAENRYQQLNDLASLGWRDTDIQNLSKFSSLSSTGNRYLVTLSSPTLDNLDSLNWITMRVSASQLRQTDPLPKLTGGIDPASLSWWYWSSSSDVDLGACHDELDSADFTIEFEVALASIKRVWLDQQVFESQAWRWKSDSTELLSDGESDNNKGSSPLFPRSIVLVKSLTITGPSILPCLHYVRKAVSNSHEVGFGPFRLAGSTVSSTPYYLPPVISQTAIHVVYPQMLGYGVTILPKTPNPNPNFVWPNK